MTKWLENIIYNVIERINGKEIKIANLIQANTELKLQYSSLLKQWNTLADKINKKGGELFLRDGVLEARGKYKNNINPFTQKDLNDLIKLCHPDKHGGNDPLAEEMTKKLLLLRK